jgi:DMSO/TMAO reductase YedYZ molybdopterin-dependent catalytic subunit
MRNFQRRRGGTFTPDRWLGAALAGGAAVMLILAALLPLHLLFGFPYAPLHVANQIIETSDANVALALQRWLGPLALPSAVLGGIMFVASFGLLNGLLYRAIIARFGDDLRGVAMVVSCLIQPILMQVAFGLEGAYTTPFLLTGLLISLITRNDERWGRVNLSRRHLLQRVAIFSLGGIVLGVIKGIPTVISELSQRTGVGKLFDFTPPAARVSGFDVPDLSPEVTPLPDFYKMRKFPTPIPDVPSDWRLTIDGLVRTPLTFSLDDLLALPRTDMYMTRQCISNPVGGNMISTALMSGVWLRTLVERAGVLPSVSQIVFHGRDGYSETIPLDYGLTHGLIALGMNGEGLPAVHGAPCRVEMPGLYGFKSLKWLDRIELIDYRYVAIWEAQGWTATPTVKTMSRVDACFRDGSTTVIAGVAFAGLRGISKVEVKVNDGAWQPATLHVPPLSDQTWVQWRMETSTAGELRITVRAVDGERQPQIEAPQPQKPDGATGLHEWRIRV